MELFIILSSYFIAALLGLLLKRREIIEGALVAASVVSCVESVIIALKVSELGAYAPNSFFFMDSLGAIVMLTIAFVGLASAVYSVQYLRQETAKNIIGLTRVRQYFVLMNLFLAAMYLAITATSPIFAWISIEATTLSTAFLISFYNKPSAMEAAWKYLIVNSLGLLLGFFGTLLYFTSVHGPSGNELISWQSLMANAAGHDPLITKIAFIFVLVGYGTKVGFAPMHTWKPDAYSKAPAPLGALFSGALLPVSFSIILRFKAITDVSVGSMFSQELLLVFGLLSIAIAALIMFVAKNYKRLLAYSSIENAGIVALGFGFGGIGVLASMLHMIYHSLIKAALFFTSGNLMLKYHSAKISNIRGALRAVPVTSLLFLVGFFAITGSPPFGIFLTKLSILSAGISEHPIMTAASLFLMAFLFIGFLTHTTAMLFGEAPADTKDGEISVWLIIPPLALIVVALYLSFSLPQFLTILLNDVVAFY